MGEPDQVGADMSVELPDLESDDPAVLAALYGAFGFADHYRKIVLSDVKELLRAALVGDGGKKVTEARLDDLSHTHTLYIDFLARALRGRVKYHQEVLSQEGYAHGR
jgi:hypothetical protein